MKNINKLAALVLILGFLTVNTAFSITPADYKNVVKMTKKMSKLADKHKIEELAQYYSDDYKSFDGYNKKEIVDIFKAASELYPESKTKEKITKIEEIENGIKVYIKETSTTKMDAIGEDALYAPNEKIKGRMFSSSYYSMNFKEENGQWKVISDEIYDESTEIRYGEALTTKFEMEAPDNIKPGEEFTVKTTIEAPKDRIVVGSIGHDKIIFPPEKYLDPYRTINESGILERVMIANKDGKNEYANSSYALIAPFSNKKGASILKARPSISGMGIYVKRMNKAKEEIL